MWNMDTAETLYNQFTVFTSALDGKSNNMANIFQQKTFSSHS